MGYAKVTDTIALTHQVSSGFVDAERTFVEFDEIDLDRARAQHQDYCATLERCGVKVIKSDINRRFPDSVFVEDSFVVLPELAILCAMGVASRQLEPVGLRSVLEGYRTILPIKAPGQLEGGDVLRVGKRLFVGKSTRTNDEGIKQLVEAVRPHGYQVDVVGVRGALHLKTAMCAIDEDRLIANRDWLQLPSALDMSIVDVPSSEPWGANLIKLGANVVMSARHSLTAARLEELGMQVHAVDISEFEKAEGGVTCMSVILD